MLRFIAMKQKPYDKKHARQEKSPLITTFFFDINNKNSQPVII